MGDVKDIDRQLLDLTDLWYRYVLKCYHKDKDCHFSIRCDYGYGQAPTFFVMHHGYRAGEFGVGAESLEQAKELLADKLKKMLRDALSEASVPFADDDVMCDREGREQELELLEKNKRLFT